MIGILHTYACTTWYTQSSPPPLPPHTHTQQAVTVASLREDREIKDFLLHLVSTFLNKDSQYARIDILHCPVGQSQEGEKLIQSMKDLLKVPVTFSSDILGMYVSEGEQSGLHDEGTRCVCVDVFYVYVGLVFKCTEYKYTL